MIYTPLTKKAMRLAYEKHEGQLDKAGLPYIFHPMHLAEQMTDEYSTIAALLHDLVEDTNVTIEELRREFPSEVCDAVSLLTKPDDADYFDYVREIVKNPIARKVKLADLAHNSDLSRLDGEPDEQTLKRVEKYIRATEILLNGEACRKDSLAEKTHVHPLKHFHTITKHRHKVISHCFRVGIGRQGLRHDLSKYTPAEFIPGAKYYLGTRSPNERERELFGSSMAWMHHKGRNKHHFEYWNDLNLRTHKYEPVPMPLRYLTEMFCDRVAASKIYQGDRYTDSHPLEYFRKGNAAKKMHAETARVLEEWLIMLAEHGEKATFAHIKRLNKENRKKK